MRIFERLATLVFAFHNSEQSGNWDWQTKHLEKITRIMKDQMPNGSGFDAGTQIEMDESNHEKLVFTTSFHHMNDVGMYDGWTEHKVTVRPSFVFGFEIRISGRNRNDIKEHIAQTFHEALNQGSD